MLALWHWKVTALQVGLVGALAGLAAAVLSPLSNWLVARGGYRSGRKARIHDDRRDAYEAILVDVYRGRGALESIIGTLDDGQSADVQRELAEATIGSPEQLAERLARVALFSSDRVVECHSAFIDAWNALADGVEDRPIDTGEQRAELAVWLTAEWGKLQQTVTSLRHAVRDDLTT